MTRRLLDRALAELQRQGLVVQLDGRWWPTAGGRVRQAARDLVARPVSLWQARAGAVPLDQMPLRPVLPRRRGAG